MHTCYEIQNRLREFVRQTPELAYDRYNKCVDFSEVLFYDRRATAFASSSYTDEAKHLTSILNAWGGVMPGMWTR